MKVEKNFTSTCSNDPVSTGSLNEKSITKVISTAMKVAPCALVIAALSNLPVVDAGPVSGSIAYWLSKAIFYKTAVSAGSAAITSASGPIIVTAAVAATGAIGVSSAAAIVAKGVLGTIAAVETTSAGVGLFFTAIPFLP